MVFTIWRERRLRKQAHRIALCLVLGLLFIRTIRDQLDAIARESPVDFSPLHERADTYLQQPEKAVRHFNGSHIDERYHLQRTLKAGGQGSVYLYHDAFSAPTKLVIVKTISAVARNKLPPQLLHTFGNFTSTWPSEIDASLSVTAASQEEAPPYVPVHDYFILEDSSPSAKDWTWALVTPFISAGTIHDLAKELRSIGRTEHIDKTYRSTFYKLLIDLQELHRRQFCHDDIKPKNIFVESSTRWLLGDLGNTRQVDHAWHGTRLWKRRNQWSDCQLNDIRRALKSYLFFLRDASHDREQFDTDFLDGSTDWARMYWSFVQSPSAWSATFAVEGAPVNETWSEGSSRTDGPPRWYTNSVDSSLRAVAVKQELLCTSLWWKLWFTP